MKKMIIESYFSENHNYTFENVECRIRSYSIDIQSNYNLTVYYEIWSENGIEPLVYTKSYNTIIENPYIDSIQHLEQILKDYIDEK